MGGVCTETQCKKNDLTLPLPIGKIKDDEKGIKLAQAYLEFLNVFVMKVNGLRPAVAVISDATPRFSFLHSKLSGEQAAVFTFGHPLFVS